ncbi:nuclear transport factor 2 family protein [Foetidibacter luteolus]|uniref:nuclear transport factor 2 family protein n=1 Tax=Foetidibacter luteolus TaxID=2608880 RepID=UPI00129A3801|nr:nuclear transport factor 2 family protein [Foetidibacter luteolus]
MSRNNKLILEKANDAIMLGDNEGFLAFCTDDTKWVFVGERTLSGKKAVREWMKEFYKEPPKFTVTNMIVDGDFVVALGSIKIKDEKGEEENYSYCDVWQFSDSMIAWLNAFVIKSAD